jgi:tripartite-type tricarboxylate transporter receptor subunit TctC
LLRDSVRDFTSISVVGTAPRAIEAHPSVPATTPRELIDYAKAARAIALGRNRVVTQSARPHKNYSG